MRAPRGADSFPARMRRQPSLVTRLFRALTALVTVWCLGCSGFEPLVSGLLGANVGGMTCGGESSAPRSLPSAGGAGVATQASIGGPADAHGDRGYDCGCQSCHAAEAQLAAMPQRAGVAVPPAPAAVERHLSIEREPLVPPPQLAL